MATSTFPAGWVENQSTRLLRIIFILTGTYTLWAWLFLDINPLLMSKLFYRGEAPMEYALNARSKAARKAWEKDRKALQS